MVDKLNDKIDNPIGESASAKLRLNKLDDHAVALKGLAVAEKAIYEEFKDRYAFTDEEIQHIKECITVLTNSPKNTRNNIMSDLVIALQVLNTVRLEDMLDNWSKDFKGPIEEVEDGKDT